MTRHDEDTGHIPVLLDSVLRWLAPGVGERVLDATLGAGGHAKAFLEATEPDGRVWGLDADAEAVRFASRRLAPFADRFAGIHGNFRDLAMICQKHDIRPDVILMDLGVSSRQLDDRTRGFSFRAEGPIDMRLDPSLGAPAADLVNCAEEQELADCIYSLGEERRARRIAAAILNARRSGPIRTTVELADIVTRAVRPDRKLRIHPATRTFLALRLATNRELEALQSGVAAALAQLAPGGRLGVISFMSLEDRIVKNAFRACDADVFEILTPKPITATRTEVSANRRARSAKFRVIRKQASLV